MRHQQASTPAAARRLCSRRSSCTSSHPDQFYSSRSSTEATRHSAEERHAGCSSVVKTGIMDYEREFADSPVAEHDRKRTVVTRRKFLLGAAARGCGGLALYSGEIARHEISIVTRRCPHPQLAAGVSTTSASSQISRHPLRRVHRAMVRAPRGRPRQRARQPDLVAAHRATSSALRPCRGTLPWARMHRCAEILRGIACPQRFAVHGQPRLVSGSADYPADPCRGRIFRCW